MTVSLTTAKSQAIIPALTSSVTQLVPAMQQTQESLQGLVTKVTDALASSEERGRKLEGELLAARAQQAAERAASEARERAQQKLIDTLQNTVASLQKEVTTLIDREKTVEKTLACFITRYNTHVHSHFGANHGLGTMQTSSPGIRTYAGQQGCIFTSHAFPEPKFDEKKTS